MSQANNHVTWCLKKAEKEMQESGRHRGLMKIPTNIEEAQNHITKAEHNFDAVHSFQEMNFSDWSVSAAFYTMYHCLLAILAKHGYESRNQECTISCITMLKEEGKIELSDSIIEALRRVEPDASHEKNVVAMRESFQYGVRISADEEELRKLTEICKLALREAKQAIFEK